MSKKKDVVINVEPFNVESRRYEGGFELKFRAMTKSGINKTINIKADRWWLSHIAEELKKVLTEEQQEMNRLTDLVGFKDSD